MIRNTSMSTYLNWPPGSLGLPFMGEERSFAKDKLSFFTYRHQHYGEVFKTQILGFPTIVFGGVEPVAFLLMTGKEHFTIYNNDVVTTLFGNALFMLSGVRHLEHHIWIQSALRASMAEQYIPLMIAITRSSVEHWNNRPYIEIHQECLHIMSTICARVLIGIESVVEEQVFQEIFQRFLRGAQSRHISHWPLSPYQQGFASANELRKLIQRQIDRALLQPKNDVLSRLLETHPQLSDTFSHTQVQDHILALLVAAYETTASLATWLLYEIALQPQLVQQIRTELHQAAKKPPLTLPHRTEMPWLWSSIHEAERLHAPNILSTRQVLHHCHFASYDIPQGWHAIYSPAANHFSKTIFPYPYSFCPHRFLTSPAAQFKLLTFGAGPHACVGKYFAQAQLYSLVYAIFSFFDLRILPNQAVRATYRASKVPQNGIYARLHPAVL